jgi:hypothetical protein
MFVNCIIITLFCRHYHTKFHKTVNTFNNSKSAIFQRFNNEIELL